LDLEVGDEDIVMVNNPPGYFASTGRWAIAIPDGDLNTTMVAGARYQARYLLLDENSPQGLKQLYQSPVDQPGIDYIKSIENIHIFSLNNLP
jgi:hypothetical protein